MSILTQASAETIPVLFGTSPGRNDSKGIYATYLDTQSGKLQNSVRLVAELKAPGFLDRHPSRPIVYAVAADPADNSGILVALKFSDSATGPALEVLANVSTTRGKGAHLAVHQSGELIVTAQYGDGSIAVLPLDEKGIPGKPSQVIDLKYASGVNPARQEGPHPHNVTFSPCGKYVMVPDLGADCTYIFAVDLAKQQLVAHGQAKCAPGAGPRHMKFSPDGKFAYVLNELTVAVDAFAWDSQSGTMTHVGTFAALSDKLNKQQPVNSGSEIRIHPSGRFLYTANRGNDSISVFSVDPESGRLDRIQVIPVRAAWPRNFAIDPSGRFIVCAGQDSSTAGSFGIDQESGRLTFVAHSSVVVPGAICVLFVD